MKQTLLQIYFNIFKILAKIYLLRNPAYIIWVTWSIWKTSCRMIINDVLKNNLEDKKVYTSEKNFNWELWMSLSILWISSYKPELKSVIETILKSLKIAFLSKKLYDVIILEYWIDHPGEMDFLLSIAKPNIWVITKIDKVHSLQFSSPEITASEKYKLLIWSKDFAFINLDDEYFDKYENKIQNKIYFNTNLETPKNEEIKWENYKLIQDNWNIKSDFDLFFQGEKKAFVSSNLIWAENVSYISLWFKILDLINIHFYKKSFFPENIKEININFKLQPSRFSIFSWINESLIIDSSYNAAPMSVRKIILNTLDIQENFFSDYKKIFCLWEMRELWTFAKKEHEELAEFVFWKAEFVFVVWESMKKYFLPKMLELWFDSEKAIYFEDSFKLWEYLRSFLLNSENKHLILFKWSQNTIFLEEAIKFILAYKVDESNLCRQDSYWLGKKWVK